MTLDATQFDAVTDLLATVDRPDRRRDRRALAERVWTEAFVEQSEAPIEPIDPPSRHSGDIGTVALRDHPFEAIAAVDAGSLNPTVYQNGFVVDVAHAALATTPSDVGRHRGRSIVAVVHGPPAEARSTEWSTFDHGYGRARLIASPTFDREEDTVVHTLALESAEVEHALEAISPHDDLIALDGSVYPASLLHWEAREGTLRGSIFDEAEPRGVLERSIELVARGLASDTPVVGVVKNWTARGFVRAVRDAEVVTDVRLPWPTDYALFQQVLMGADPDESSLRWTSWFTMDFGVGAAMRAAIERLEPAIAVDVDDLQLAFMAVYHPRENVVFRIEAPLGAVREPATRGAITDYVVAEIAAEGGPPTVLQKADELARIGRSERRKLRLALAEVLDTTLLRRFDDIRWA